MKKIITLFICLISFQISHSQIWQFWTDSFDYYIQNNNIYSSVKKEQIKTIEKYIIKNYKGYQNNGLDCLISFDINGLLINKQRFNGKDSTESVYSYSKNGILKQIESYMKNPQSELNDTLEIIYNRPDSNSLETSKYLNGHFQEKELSFFVRSKTVDKIDTLNIMGLAENDSILWFTYELQFQSKYFKVDHFIEGLKLIKISDEQLKIRSSLNEFYIEQNISRKHIRKTYLLFGRKNKSTIDFLNLNDMYGGYIESIGSSDWYYKNRKLRTIKDESGFFLKFEYGKKRLLSEVLLLDENNIIIEKYTYKYTFY